MQESQYSTKVCNYTISKLLACNYKKTETEQILYTQIPLGILQGKYCTKYLTGECQVTALGTDNFHCFVPSVLINCL